MKIRAVVLPGDGIGPEVTAEAVRVLDAVARVFAHDIDFTFKSIGGSAIKQYGNPLPDATLEACLESDAVLLGAAGDPAFDQHPTNLRPEAGLLKLRRG